MIRRALVWAVVGLLLFMLVATLLLEPAAGAAVDALGGPVRDDFG
jgi:hypothetical protein